MVSHDIDFNPALFRSIQPAWSDQNLKNLAGKIRSDCFFAHVRSASSGQVAQWNCHPFNYKQYLFMHNGDLGDFEKIKRHIRHELSTEIYNWVEGQTDSEHFFGLFLEAFAKSKLAFNPNNAAKILIKTIKMVLKLKKDHDSQAPIYLNCVLTNGKSMIAARYCSDPTIIPPTLFQTSGSDYECKEGISQLTKKEAPRSMFVTSERLTHYHAEWLEIPANHLLLVEDDLKTSFQAIT